MTIMHVNEYKPCSQESTFPRLLPDFQIQQGVLLFGHLVPGTANEKMCYEYSHITNGRLQSSGKSLLFGLVGEGIGNLR